MGAYLNFDGKEWHADVVSTEQAEHTVTATEHAVEEGVNVSDHVRPNLERITLECIISNTPIVSRGSPKWPTKKPENLYGGSREGVELNPLEGRQKATGYSDKPAGPFPVSPGALFAVIGNAITSLFGDDGPTKATVDRFSGAPFDAVRDTLNTLLDWQHRAVVGEVITPHRTYSNMIIERVSPMRDSTTGASARISIELREIRKVSSKLITSPLPNETRGKQIIQKGKQPVTTASGAQTSIAKGLVNRIKGK